MPHANYDAIAGLYDPLARLVFGKAIVRSQVFLLHHIPAGASVLIVGGGTGWILEELAFIHPSGLHICYVEVSRKMTALARSRNAGQNKVLFVEKAIQEVALSTSFDVVITPFVLDNFDESSVQQVVAKLHHSLSRGGYWLFADFQVHKNSVYQRLLLRIMYLFFRLSSNLRTSRLSDTTQLFHRYRYKAIFEQTFFHSFIKSIVYQKK